MTWTCSDCGIAHEKLPASVEWNKPYDFFTASPEERDAFVRVSNVLCHLGDDKHFIRAEVTLSISQHAEPMVLRVWAGVSRQNFWRYADFLDHEDEEPDPPPLPAFFCGVVEGLPHEELLWSKIWLRARRGTVPSVFVDDDHVLAKALSEGVSVPFAKDIVRAANQTRDST